MCRGIISISDLNPSRAELVDRLLYTMALIGKYRRSDGNLETSFDPDEIFQEMIF